MHFSRLALTFTEQTSPAEVGCKRRVQERRWRLALAAAGGAGQGHPAAAGGRGEHQDLGRGAQGEPGGRVRPAPHQRCESCRPTQQRLSQPYAGCDRHAPCLDHVLCCSSTAHRAFENHALPLHLSMAALSCLGHSETRLSAAVCGRRRLNAYACHECAAGNAHERDAASNRCTMTSAAPVRHLRDAPRAPITRLPTDVPVPAGSCSEAGSSGDQISFKLGRQACPHGPARHSIKSQTVKSSMLHLDNEVKYATPTTLAQV